MLCSKHFAREKQGEQDLLPSPHSPASVGGMWTTFSNLSRGLARQDNRAKPQICISDQQQCNSTHQSITLSAAHPKVGDLWVPAHSLCPWQHIPAGCQCQHQLSAGECPASTAPSTSPMEKLLLCFSCCWGFCWYLHLYQDFCCHSSGGGESNIFADN